MGLRWQRGLTGVSSAPSWLGSFRPEPFGDFPLVWSENIFRSIRYHGVLNEMVDADTWRRREARARPWIVVSLEQARRPSYQRILKGGRGEEDFRLTVRTDASTPNKPPFAEAHLRKQKKGKLNIPAPLVANENEGVWTCDS